MGLKILETMKNSMINVIWKLTTINNFFSKSNFFSVIVVCENKLKYCQDNGNS